jgi:hypothetical protein
VIKAASAPLLMPPGPGPDFCGGSLPTAAPPAPPAPAVSDCADGGTPTVLEGLWFAFCSLEKSTPGAAVADTLELAITVLEGASVIVVAVAACDVACDGTAVDSSAVGDGGGEDDDA